MTRREHRLALTLVAVPVAALAAGSWVALAAGGTAPTLTAELTQIDAAESRTLARQVRSRLKVAAAGTAPMLQLRHEAAAVAAPAEPPATPAVATPAAEPTLEQRPTTEPRAQARRVSRRARVKRPAKIDLSRRLGEDAARLSRKTGAGAGASQAAPGKAGTGGKGASQGHKGGRRLHALPAGKRGQGATQAGQKRGSGRRQGAGGQGAGGQGAGGQGAGGQGVGGQGVGGQGPGAGSGVGPKGPVGGGGTSGGMAPGSNRK